MRSQLAGLPRAPALRRWAATVLVAALLAYLALTPLVPFARDTYGGEVRRHIILGGVIASYVAGLFATRRMPPRTALDLPALAVLLAMAVAVAGSLDRRVSAEAVLTVLPVAPLFYLLADRRLLDAHALRRGMLLGGAVVAGCALASVWRQWQEWLTLVRAVDGGLSRAMWLPPSVPRVEGVGSHPNVVAAVLAVAAPFYLLSLADLTLRPPSLKGRGGAEFSRKMGRAAVGSGLVLIGAALFFTLSRAAWAGAAAGLTVTAAGMAAAGHFRPRRRGWWLLGGAAALAAALVVVVAMGRARPDWLFRDSLDPRADMRRAGLEMFRDHPLTGAGPGLYVPLYPAYGGAHPFAAVHSHNVAVQIAADYGLAGLAAGGFMLAAATLLLVRLWARGAREQRWVAAATAGALTAFLVHGLADAPHLFPEVLLMLAAGTALAVRAGDEFTTEARRHGDIADRGVRHTGCEAPGSALRALRSTFVTPCLRASVVHSLPALVVLAVGVALIPAWRYTDRAAAEYQRSVRAAAAGRWDEAIRAAERAAVRDPRLAAYHLQLGATHFARYREQGKVGDRDAALRAYERALARSDEPQFRVAPIVTTAIRSGRDAARPPRNGAAYVDLAVLRRDAGDVAGARDAVESLGPLVGRDSLLQLAYAVLVQRTGSHAQAVETYAGLLALNPTLALTPFWRYDDFRRAHYDAIVERSLERAEEIAGPAAAEGLQSAIRLLTGRGAPRADDLRAALAAAPGDVSLQLALGRLLTAGGRREEAEPLLRDAVARKGDSAGAHAALGDWYAASGDLAHARREWLRAAYLGDVAAGDALGQSFSPGPVPEVLIGQQRRLVEGAEIGRFYLPFQTFRFTFRRHEPVPIISPGDWLLALPDGLPRWRANLRRWEEERNRQGRQARQAPQ